MSQANESLEMSSGEPDEDHSDISYYLSGNSDKEIDLEEAEDVAFYDQYGYSRTTSPFISEGSAASDDEYSKDDEHLLKRRSNATVRGIATQDETVSNVESSSKQPQDMDDVNDEKGQACDGNQASEEDEKKD